MTRSSFAARTGLRILPLLILVAEGFVALPPRAVLAADSSDIPGIPLVGPIATGVLGGPIYDVVYQVNVPAGSVVLASLRGTEGTDFDLYLFDSTATTVFSNVGVVARSLGPTSEESLAYATPSGGRFYLDLHGASEETGTYTLLFQAVPDGTPPTVSISPEGGRTSVNVGAVDLTVTAADDLSGVPDMAFSTDGTTFGPWQPFATRAHVPLPTGDGIKVIWAKVRNGVGLESAAASVSIVLDTRPPSATGISPVPGSRTAGVRPKIGVTFDEPMDPVSWAHDGLVVMSPLGLPVEGTYSMDAARRVGTFIPSGDLVPGQAYVVSLGAVTDLAGNRVLGVGAWTVTPVLAASISVATSPSTIVFGGTSRLTATYLTGVPPQPVTIAARPATDESFGSPVPLGAWPNGPFTTVVHPEVNTTYRVSAPGSSSVADASADVRVLVRRQVTLAAVSGGAGSSRVGRSVVLEARVAPGVAGLSVSFRLYRYDAARRTWVYAGSRGRGTDATGRALYAWTPSTPGSWYWRVSVASTVDLANNISPVLRWSVTR